MMGYWSGPWMVGGGFFMMFGFLIVIALIIYLIFFRNNRIKLNSFDDQHGDFSKSNRALEILKERYAKGEINTEEYQQRKKELE